MDHIYSWYYMMRSQELAGRDIVCTFPADDLFPSPYEVRARIVQVGWSNPTVSRSRVTVTCADTVAHIVGDEIWCRFPNMDQMTFPRGEEERQLELQEDGSLKIRSSVLGAKVLPWGDQIEPGVILEGEQFEAYVNRHPSPT